MALVPRAVRSATAAPLRERLPVDTLLAVVGSQAWNPADRSLGRDAIRPLQLVGADDDHDCPGLRSVGANGLRDLASTRPGRVVVSTGYELLDVDLDAGAAHLWPTDPRSGGPAPFEGVSDLHEVAWFDDRLLVANTRADELICLDRTGAVTGRERLDRFRHADAQPIDHRRRLGGIGAGATSGLDDHFHLNQGFVGLDGRVHVLVHHISGFRPYRHARHRLTGHGDGGVIRLDDDVVVPLGLRAPHSVRPVGDGYVVADSGRSELLVTDADWKEVRRVRTPGWGRGAVVSPDGSTLFVAVSATRARYLDRHTAQVPNQVVAYDTGTWEQVGSVVVAHVEQLWSLSLLDSTTAARLAALSL